MNNTFNFRRFGLLLRKTIYEKGLFLGGIFVLVIVPILFVYNLATQITTSQSLSFIIGLFSITIIVNILLNNFSKKSIAASYLTLPCSNFEKWLSISVFAFLLYLPLFLAVLKVIDILFLDYYRELAVTKFHYSAKQIEANFPHIKYNFDEKDNLNLIMPFTKFLANFFGLGGVSVVGSLYFNQKSYIKSALVFLGLAFTLSLALNMLFDTIIGEKTSTGIFSFTKAVITTENERLFTINASESIQQIGKYFMMIFIPMALWLIGLVRFSDKEL
jgi:hypothetical protein